jgi:dihydrofolate reductase
LKVRVVIIAAVSADGFISAGTGVPWDLPADRTHFRRLTEGQWLFLGRRTFDEMTGWFREHRPLVLTKRPLPEPWADAGVASVEEAIKRVAEADGESLWICGGASAYEAAMPEADELVLTEVKACLGAGVAFPEIVKADWQVVRREARAGAGETDFEWVWYERVRKAGSAQSSLV